MEPGGPQCYRTVRRASADLCEHDTWIYCCHIVSLFISMIIIHMYIVTCKEVWFIRRGMD
jgi:hypothetical protein